MPRLPKSLPSTDRSAIELVIRELRRIGFRPWQIFDPEKSWIDLPDGLAEVMRSIMDLDDAEVMFEHQTRGDAFWIRFVMGNDPYEVVCDHTFREEGDAGYDAYQVVDGIINHWINIESEAL